MGYSAKELAALDDDQLHEQFDLPAGSWAPALLRDIAEQADERGILPEDIPALVRSLDRLDYDRLFADLATAAVMLDLHAGTLAAYARDKQGFWLPTFILFDDEGNAKVKAWLIRKLEVLDRRRRSSTDPRHTGWRARKRRERQAGSDNS